MISLDDPPSSETGNTYVAFPNAAQMELQPVPPDTTTNEGSSPEVPFKSAGAMARAGLRRFEPAGLPLD